ncbi:sister chromatid cohesion protein DCC1 [Impatiens glandulifera]|uniref:sister chromatid cohesion protein DCC1 n=1 Tax=Impatiens glandulifera TaxID=253017 RepID=UPI001FB08195|nr:sister chromatid cohesion protein DCC1 [Impatiens glandulifera]
MEMEIGGAQTILNLKPNSFASVVYHSQFGPHDDLMLLELEEKLVPDILNQRVTLRGEPNDDTVLCTQSKTYSVKFVGTSNSVLLIPPENSDSNGDSEKKLIAPVFKVAIGNMELVEVAPKLDKLKLLLSEKPYKDDDVEEMVESLYEWDDLVERVQASDDQIRSGLETLSAVEIGKYWRIIDEAYMDSVLSMLLNNAILNDWSLNELNESNVVSTLEADGFLGKIARHCLKVFGSKVDDCVWRLEEKRVCLHYAKRVLIGGKMKLENFMVEWEKKVPDGMVAKFEMLEGEVLVEKIGIATWIYGFSVSSLPATPAERFGVLFRERSRWKWNDLQPFIRDLNVPGLSSDGLLLKFTRRTQPSPDAEPVFSAR